jgi:hypothetical protein
MSRRFEWRHPVELSLLQKDCLLEHAHRPAGLDPELVAQPAAQGGEGPQCLRLATCAIERQEEMGPEALTVGMIGYEGLQLGYHLPVAPKGELSLEASLEDRKTSFFQAGRGCDGERLG